MEQREIIIKANYDALQEVALHVLDQTVKYCVMHQKYDSYDMLEDIKNMLRDGRDRIESMNRNFNEILQLLPPS